MRFVSIVELYVIVNKTKVLNFTQKCFYGEFMFPERLKGT